ncbi:hypothetical protein CBER1_03718 [Cercospora berteroae]|uniref:BTB domain-containing protein n=1 Tax=Cercospora berteroae TaxID=357750 RepID=A0A2S6C7A8_9PEZI|nr:hypothetical protein CBER1_03718 [Cercospora berteroae]
MGKKSKRNEAYTAPAASQKPADDRRRLDQATASEHQSRAMSTDSFGASRVTGGFFSSSAAQPLFGGGNRITTAEPLPGTASNIFKTSTAPVPLFGTEVSKALTALPAAKSAPLKPHRQVKRFDPTSPIISVNIGTSETGTATFYVHQDILRRSSEFLQAKCKDIWSRASNAVEIPNHSPAAFNLFVNWAYSGSISLAEEKKELPPKAQVECDMKPATPGKQEEESPDGAQAGSDAKTGTPVKQQDEPSNDAQAEAVLKSVTSNEKNEWIILAEAYVLGEELIDAKFQDDILAAMKFKQWYVDHKTIEPLIGDLSNIIYGGTMEDSAARRFLVSLYATRVTKTELVSKKGTLIPDFVFDVLLAKIPG